MSIIKDSTLLIPEGIVYTLFDQVKQSSDDNDVSIRELTDAINILAANVTTPPMNSDVINVIKEHDKHALIKDSIDAHDSRVEARISKVHDRIELIPPDIKKESMTLLYDKLDSLSTKIVTMIVVVMVTFTLMTVSYMFVRHGIQQTIEQQIERTLTGK